MLGIKLDTKSKYSQEWANQGVRRWIKMNKEWRWWLAEFGLATVVAVVAGFVTKDIPISVLYGLFVGTVFFVLRELRRVVSQFDRQVSEMENKALNLPTTLSQKEDVDPYLKQIFNSERNQLLRMAKEITDGEIVLHSRPVGQTILDFWKLVRPGDRVIATNTGVGWGTPQHDLLRQLNFDLVEKGADITRVFIEPTTATPEDKKRLKQEMDRQKGHLHVRFIKESRLPPDALKNGGLIVDRIYGYTIYSKALGSGLKQILDEVRYYTRRDELDKAKVMAENIIRLSEEYK
jgi:hypothetical protein